MAGKAGGYEKKIFSQNGINVQSEKSLESLMGESRKMAKGFIESAVKLSELQAKAQLEKTIEEYMNSIDMINKANIEYTEDLMIKNGYKNEGNAFRKNIMIDATISEVIYKDVFVDSYQAYAPAGGTPTVSRLMKGGDGSSIDNVFGAMDALKEWSETIFGKKDEEGNTKTKEISSLRKWSASEKALALQLEEDWNKTHLHQEKKTKKFNQEVDEIKQKLANDKNETILDGEINEWAGYGPVFRNTSFDIGKGMSYNLLDEGSGQYGKIYSAFSWNSYLENAGISEQVKPDYDKKLWYSESDWFTPPTIRDVIDIAVTVTLTVATGGTAVAPYAALIGLSDNIAFYAMDYGGGYATANEVALGIGKDLLVAGASCGLSFAGDAVEGAINGVEKTLASGEKVIEGGINSATGKIAAKTGWAMTSSYATSVTNNFANSFYIDKDTGKIGFDEQSFGKSFYSASTIAGMVGAGVTTGLSSWSGMELESLGKEGKAIEKFYGGAINLGIAGAGKAAEYGTYLAYAKGDFSQAFDDMGLTLNIADLGSMVDMVSTIGARTNATGQSVLGDLADKLSGQGILELHLSSSGATMNFGTGGTNIAGDLYELTKRMIDKASLENYAAKNGSEKGNAAYWAYVYGDRTQENTAARIASAKDILELAKDGNFTAQTVQNASGNGRIITMKDSGDDFQNAIQLGHEAYRDGRIGSDAAQNAETLQAVLAHSSMAAEMAGDGIELNGLTALEAALYAAGRTDLLAGLASGMYDSSADYWRLMSDGSFAYDGSGYLKDENGMYINSDGTRTSKITKKTIGAEKVETGLLNILYSKNGYGKKYADFTDEQKDAAQKLMHGSGMKMGDGDKYTAQWIDDGKDHTIKTGKYMKVAGNTVATQVFMQAMDSKSDSMIFGNSLDRMKVNASMYGKDYADRFRDFVDAKTKFLNDTYSLVSDNGTYISNAYQKESDINYKNYLGLHYGIDLSGLNIEGTGVTVGLAGKIISNTAWNGKKEGSGNSVHINYGFGFEGSFYNTGIYGEYDHFQSRSLFNVGTYVNSRDIIGAVGNTGNSDGAHLHYTVYTTGTSNYNTNIMATVFGQNYLSTMMQSHNYTSGNGEPLNKYVYDPTYFYTNNRRGR